VRHLGDTVYGLWILIASLTGYFSVLDLGISGSLARNLAVHRSHGDVPGMNRLLSTALAILLGVALLVFLATLGVLIVFFQIFDVPTDQVSAVEAAVLLIGINIALSFPLGIFSGILWAYERFDLQNRIDIPTVILRAALSVWCVKRGDGLLALAIVTLATSLAQGSLKAIQCFQIEPHLRFSQRLLDAQAGRTLFGYGIWYFLLSLSRTIGPQLSPTLVGNRLGAAVVTALRIPMQLTTYANTFLIAGTQVLTPLATAQHASSRREDQQRLFLEGGRFALLMALAFLTLFGFLGEPLIRLWIGWDYAYTWTFLMILALGELLPMSQWISYSVILGMGKHKPMALMSVAENIAMAILVWLLVDSHGLVGVSLAIAIPGALSRGLFQLWYACRIVGVSPWTYLRRTILPTLVLSVPSAALLAGWTWWFPVTNWWQLIVAGLLYTAACLATAGLGLIGVAGCKQILGIGEKPDAVAATSENAS
jgi:O-antigen/teichoic acid export membrane protein